MLRVPYRAFALLLIVAVATGSIAHPLPTSAEVQRQPGLAARQAAPRLYGTVAPDVSGATVALAEIPLTRLLRATAPPPRAASRGDSAGLSGLAPKGRPLPQFLAGDGPWMRGARVAQTERLDLYVGLRTFSAEQVASVAPRIEALLRENEARFGWELDRRVSLAFYRPSLAPSADTRGIAYTEHLRAEVYYRPHEDMNRALVIAAHELAHQLQARRYGDAAQKRADLIMLEGLATWISGRPWLARYGVSSWKVRAQQLRDAGVPLRLLSAERYGPDNAYELWASFVDFLIERYGIEKLHAVYVTGRGRAPGSSDYAGVYGKSLEELADEWRAWVGE